MMEFWKRPKFWLSLIIIGWLAYVIGSNLEQPVTIHIVPWIVQPTLKLSTIMVGAAIVGAILALTVQFMWRRHSATTPAAPTTMH